MIADGEYSKRKEDRNDIICPNTAGGNVNDLLYLTATNRATYGVEAFVVYYKQEIFHFKVFDWARASGDYWKVDMPRDQLGNYLKTTTINGSTYQCITVRSETYASSLAAQKASDTHPNGTGHTTNTWGPVVETFQASYANVSSMGFDNTYLSVSSSMGANPSWSSIGPLTDGQSTVRNDNQGFVVNTMYPNFRFIVR